MSVSLSTQLLTVALITLQRQLQHNRVINNNNAAISSSPSSANVDYIIVGGGTAGCIVAGRLTENSSVSVLLLEAEMSGVIDLADEVWPYSTVRQQSASEYIFLAFAFASGTAALPYGKVLGGSHVQTLNVYTRGNRRDYDRWAGEFGARGWGYEDVLPYFMRSENNTDPKVVAANRGLHGTAGPVEVSTVPNPDPFELRWQAIVNASGWPIADYGNSEAQYGFSIPQVTQSATNWTRRSTGSAYIEDNSGRGNLRVQLFSHVTRVLFDGQRRAIGVEYRIIRGDNNNQTYQVYCRREVILSAGAINSPQLLMLSGIGPRDHLSSLGIPVLADLPAVGSRMQSHASVPMDFSLVNQSEITLLRNIDNQGLTIPNLYDFYVHSSGPLRQRPVAMMYIATGVSGDRDWPDGYLVLTSGAVFTDSLLEAAVQNYRADRRTEWRQYLRQYLNNERHLYLTFLNYRPLSRGTVRLASRDPLQSPLIDPAFFSDRQDLAAMVAAMSIGFALFETPAARSLFTYSALPVPGCAFCPDRPLSRCFTYLACVAQSVTVSDWHDCATVPMGSDSSGNASALDEHLRVRGVQGLRVMDASVMPAIPNANTLAAAMMIGEKGARLLLQTD
ncbi:hypothetical protein TYRP_018361 [Tyrophagus putrescentiae]|nr:hypothetical protein TYRP_018361 [Tyrophagus putrescentiae]